MGAVFFDAVRTAGLHDYSQAQVEAWAAAMPDPAMFDACAKDGRLILVAVNEVDEPIAYGDLEANGHIDHLYCRPEVIGTGVASALYDRLEQQARYPNELHPAPYRDISHTPLSSDCPGHAQGRRYPSR